MTDYLLLTDQLRALAQEEPWYVPLLSNASALLYQSMDRLNWAGFYLVSRGNLVLGPFQGKTACIHIPAGRGVCGTALAQDRCVRVEDVHAFPGHIACDSASNSEIVLPVHAGGRVVAVLDLDSPEPARFTEDDQAGLEAFVRALEETADFSYVPLHPEETAYLAGGCFWCIAPALRELEGVVSVVSGYSGGDEAFPRYEDVKAQKTGHRETIQVRFNPDRVSYRQVVDRFLENVDPFDAGGQFIDRGHSYTLAVYPVDDRQNQKALEALSDLERAQGRPACIGVEPFKTFYPAEAHHQDFDLKNPEAYLSEMAESGRKAAGKFVCPIRKKRAERAK